MTQGSGSKAEMQRTEKKEKDVKATKVVVRCLPPTLTKEKFLDIISPVPENDYCHFVAPDMSLSSHIHTRAYINFINPDDIHIFFEKFDGYVFVDSKGNEFPAVVEYAPFQKCPKRKKKSDIKKNSVEQDSDYKKFVEMLSNPDVETIPPIEKYIEEIEGREKELKANHGVMKQSTPLLDYIKRRKDEKRAARQRAIEERKRRELERRKQKEEERRKRREREKEKESRKEKLDGEGDAPLKILKKDEDSSDTPERKTDFKPGKNREKFKEKEYSKDTNKSRSSPTKEDRSRSNRERRDRDYHDRDRDREPNKSYRRDRDRRREEKEYRDSKAAARNREKTEKTSQHASEKSHKDNKTPSKSSSQEDRHDSSKVKNIDSKQERTKTDKQVTGAESSHDKDGKDTTGSSIKGSSKDSEGSKSRVRNKDRPERAIYVPGRRAAEKRKEEERRREAKQNDQKS